MSHSLRGLRSVAALLIVGLAASLLALAGPASASSLPSRTSTESSIGHALKRVLNDERRAHHLKPLYMNSDLLHSARSHDVTMARHDTMSHQLPGEAPFTTRIEDAGYNWTWAGENIGWNSKMTRSGVLALERIMYAEKAPNDEHRQNILGRHYRNIGVDVYMDRKHHKVWLTVDFGNR